MESENDDSDEEEEEEIKEIPLKELAAGKNKSKRAKFED